MSLSSRNFFLAGALGAFVVAACSFDPRQSQTLRDTGTGAGEGAAARSPATSTAAAQRIEGTIRAPGETDLSGYDVVAFPESSLPDSRTYATRTDAGGRFAVSVPEGT
jgi:hypothetical protein